ncbi:MAG: F0F1 ATP synthase subunit delta [Eggerthellaceae bacterium]|nr:F0F1 ATP synthase subunit delta [Eggerthellaceae bacterium]
MPSNRLVEKEKVATYASVLFYSVFESGGRDAVLRVRDEIEQVVRIIRGNATLIEALCSLAYSPEQRNTMARETFTECVSEFRDMLALMAERREMDLLAQVEPVFVDVLQEKLHVTVVDVVTVVALDNHLRDIIIKKAASELGTEIVLRERIDKSILGGILMSANGKRIDASVFTQIENARTLLKKSSDGGES